MHPLSADQPTLAAGGPQSPVVGGAEGEPAALRPAAGHGRYQWIAEVGRGGCGVVAKAQDQQLGRVVAVKTIGESQASDRGYRERFWREAQLTGRLQHPGIVPVHELGESGDGSQFYVMRFLEGQNFRQMIAELHRARRDGGLSSRAFREAMRPVLTRFVAVCHAVAYAHRQGIVHRDLKPDNIMVGAFGETIVVDWGLAKECAHESGTCQTQWVEQSNTEANAAIVGTPGYMSPEQARGDSPAVGPPADIYALGAVLYHIVTGQVSIDTVADQEPREGHAAGVEPDLEAMLSQIREGRFVAPRRRLAVVPPALEAICLKAMCFDPEQRYGTADVLADEVERFIADQPITAYREPRTESLLRWVRNHRGVSISTALSVLMLLVVGTIATGLIERARRGEVRAHRELMDTTQFTMRWLADLRRTTHRWTADLESLASGDMSSRERQRVMDDAITAYQHLAAASDQASLSQPALSPEFSACWLVERADCLLQLSDLLARRQRYSASELRLRQAEDLLRQVDGNPHADVRPLRRRCEQLRAKLIAKVEESR